MRVALNGSIVSDDDAWLYDFFGFQVISPAKVRDALKENPKGETLTFEINSGGGSVFAGFEIYSVLKASAVPTVAEVQSLAASAASTVMLGCDRVLLSPVAQVMIHLPSTVTRGDVVEHDRSKNLLSSVEESILMGYETKCKGKKTRDELSAMLRATTWMSAQEAVDAGLADGILYQEDTDPKDIMNAVGCGIRSLAGTGNCLPDPQQLRAQYQSMQKKPMPELSADPPKNDWRVQARLCIEKARY